VGILLARRFALKYLAWDGKCPAMSRTSDGKPYIKQAANEGGEERWHVNISHDQDWVVFVASKGRLVGCDVMETRLRGTDKVDVFLEDMRSCLNRQEWNYVQQSGQRASSTGCSAGASAPNDGRESALLDAFMDVWCVKESILKAFGVGITFALQDVVVSFPPMDSRTTTQPEAAGAAVTPAGAALKYRKKARQTNVAPNAICGSQNTEAAAAAAATTTTAVVVLDDDDIVRSSAIYSHLVSVAGLGLSHELARKLLVGAQAQTHSSSDRKERLVLDVNDGGDDDSSSSSWTWRPLISWCLGVFKLDHHVKLAFAVSDAFAAFSSASSSKSPSSSPPSSTWTTTTLLSKKDRIDVESIRRAFCILPLQTVLLE